MAINKMEKREFLNSNGNKYKILGEYADIYLVQDIEWENYVVIDNPCKVNEIKDGLTGEIVPVYSWSYGNYFTNHFDGAFLYFVNKILKNFFNHYENENSEAYKEVEKMIDSLSEYYGN